MDLSSFIVQEDTNIVDAAAQISRNGRQIVFVCDGLKLLAALSDGDLRRYIVKGGDLSKTVRDLANYEPHSIAANELEFVPSRYIKAMPVLNEEGEITSIRFDDNTAVHKTAKLDVPVVIMAGGKGTRLAPYTNVLPKPLIPVGDKTIAEQIINKFEGFGCKTFYLILNYKRELVKAYFKEAQQKAFIHFIDEVEYQGTGGGLKLLEDSITSTFFMTNCDIIVDTDYEDILSFHKKEGYEITLVCAMKKLVVPYGTVELSEDGMPKRLIEKPEYPLLTNTGLYVIEPTFLQYIETGTFTHITDLIQACINMGGRVGVYPVSEACWMDMGQFNELHKMHAILERNLM